MENEEIVKEETKPIGIALNNTEVSKIKFFLGEIQKLSNNCRRNCLFEHLDKIFLYSDEIKKLLS